MYWLSAPSSSLSILDRISMTSGFPFMCASPCQEKANLFWPIAPVDAAAYDRRSMGHAGPILILRFGANLAQAGGLATQLAQVIELGAAHAARLDDFDLVDD